MKTLATLGTLAALSCFACGGPPPSPDDSLDVDGGATHVDADGGAANVGADGAAVGVGADGAATTDGSARGPASLCCVAIDPLSTRCGGVKSDSCSGEYTTEAGSGKGLGPWLCAPTVGVGTVCTSPVCAEVGSTEAPSGVFPPGSINQPCTFIGGCEGSVQACP